MIPASARPLVPVADAHDVLALIAQGKTVLFVDAREPEEFHEAHIPGAINLTLRELRDLDIATLGDPDLIIAYCLKDFRGFEVARALRGRTDLKVATLAQMGINGWKHEGLPVTSSQRPEAAVLAQLQVCASNRQQCKTVVQ